MKGAARRRVDRARHVARARYRRRLYWGI